MKTLRILNQTLEKYMPILTPCGVILGVILAERIAGLVGIVPAIFAFITFVGSLSTNFKDFSVIVTQPLPLIVSFLILHVLIPSIAFGIGMMFFPNDLYTITGMLLAFVIPTGIMSFLWVSMNKGNIPLTLAIIVINTILSPLVMPLSISFFVGGQIELAVQDMMWGLMKMIVIPSILGMLLNQFTKGKAKDLGGPTLAPFTKIGLVIVVAINSAVVAPYFKNINVKFFTITCLVFFIASLGYLCGFFAAKLFKWDHEITVSMTFNCGMRNISSGVVIAVAYFPPPVSVPVIVGMLFQQVLAALYSIFIRKVTARNEKQPQLSYSETL